MTLDHEVIYVVDQSEEIAVKLAGTQGEIEKLRQWATQKGFKEVDRKAYNRVMRKANR